MALDEYDAREAACLKLAAVSVVLEWAFVALMASTTDWSRLSVYFGG